MKKFWHSFLLGWVGFHWFRYDKKSKLRNHQINDIFNHFIGWFFFLGFIAVGSGIVSVDPVSAEVSSFLERLIRIVFSFVCLSFIDSFIYLCCEDKQFVKDIKCEIKEKELEDESVDVNYEIK